MSYRRTNGVTRWFHTLDTAATSPAMSVMDFNDGFLDMCEHYGFSLRVPERTFRRNMCEFVCSLRLARRYGDLAVAGPRSVTRPEGWTRDMYTRWLEYLQQFYFSSQEWDQFWKGVPVSPWEEALPTWRADIQAVAILYICGDADRLIQAGTFSRDESAAAAAAAAASGGAGNDDHDHSDL